MRHGPHHDAQKSSNTMPSVPTTSSKVSLVSSTVAISLSCTYQRGYLEERTRRAVNSFPGDERETRWTSWSAPRVSPDSGDSEGLRRTGRESVHDLEAVTWWSAALPSAAEVCDHF